MKLAQIHGRTWGERWSCQNFYIGEQRGLNTSIASRKQIAHETFTQTKSLNRKYHQWWNIIVLEYKPWQLGKLYVLLNSDYLLEPTTCATTFCSTFNSFLCMLCYNRCHFFDLTVGSAHHDFPSQKKWV